LRVFIVGTPIKQPAVFLFAHAAPLLEEERGMRFTALVADGEDPIFLHGTRSRAAFAADDGPAYVRKIERSQVFKQRFDGEEPDAGGSSLQVGDSGQAVLAIFDADAPPDVILFGGEAQGAAQQLLEPFRALGEHLKGVPLCRDHDLADGFDVGVGDAGLEKVAHRVNEYEFRRAPGERLSKLVGNQLQVEALLVGMALDSAEALGKSFGIAVLAAGADLGAAADRVPGRVGPFDLGVEGHADLLFGLPKSQLFSRHFDFVRFRGQRSLRLFNNRIFNLLTLFV